MTNTTKLEDILHNLIDYVRDNVLGDQDYDIDILIDGAVKDIRDVNDAASQSEAIFTNGDGAFTMKNRNFTHDGKGYIQDNNFDFDAGLQVSGDFPEGGKKAYAAMIASALNSDNASQREMPVNVSCWCEKCNMQANNGLRTRMSICPQCGDKRCDRALNHANNCTALIKG